MTKIAQITDPNAQPVPDQPPVPVPAPAPEPQLPVPEVPETPETQPPVEQSSDVKLVTGLSPGSNSALWLAVLPVTGSPDPAAKRLVAEISRKLRRLNGYYVFNSYNWKERTGYPIPTKMAITKKITSDNLEETRQELISLGITVDFAGLDQIEGIIKEPTLEDPDEEKNLFDRISNKVQWGAEAAKRENNSGALADNVVGIIGELADSVDETSKSEIIKQYFDFKKGFHKYSLNNQLLILFQTFHRPEGPAIYVGGETRWKKKGYQIKPEARVEGRDIDIFGRNEHVSELKPIAVQYVLKFISQWDPSTRINKKLITEVQKAAKTELRYADQKAHIVSLLWSKIRGGTIADVINTLQEAKSKGEGSKVSGRVSYPLVQVWDVADVEPNPNAKNVVPIPEVISSDEQWTAKANEQWTEKDSEDWIKVVSSYINKDTDYNLDFSETEGGEHGSASKNMFSSGPIRIHVDPRHGPVENIRTLVHELAHAKFHFGEDGGEIDKKGREVQADGTAYVVLKTLGFPVETDASFDRYLAFHGSTAEDIKQNSATIEKMTNEILLGLMQHIFLKDRKDKKASVLYNWFKQAMAVDYTYELIIEE